MLPVVGGCVTPLERRTGTLAGSAPGCGLASVGRPPLRAARGKTGASADETNSGSPTAFVASGASGPEILVSLGGNDAQAGSGGPGEAFACSDGLDRTGSRAALPGSRMGDTDREFWLELVGRSIPSPAAPDRDDGPPSP